MNHKTTLAAGTALLLAGLIAAYLTNRNPRPDPEAAPAAGKPGTAASGATPGAAQSGDAGVPGRPARSRDDVKNQDLVAKYGESRTKLAATVSNNIVAILTDATEIGEKALAGGTGGPFGSAAGMRMALGAFGNDLKLTPEQQGKALAAFQAFQRRELDRSKGSLDQLKQNPAALMKLVLASDASSRGEIGDDEYRQQQTATAQELKGVVNPLDEKNFRGGKPMRDEAFVSELKTTLDPAQTELLEAELAKQAAEATPDPNEGNISNMPKMDLEKLDQTITSVHKMTIGFKSLMEGMGGLEDLRPPTDGDQGLPAPAP